MMYSLERGPGAFNALTFSPDGSRLAAGRAASADWAPVVVWETLQRTTPPWRDLGVGSIIKDRGAVLP